MVIAGWLAVIGLLLLAAHVARPEVLRRLVDADTRLLRLLPWVRAADIFDVESSFQRVYRSTAIATLVGWTALNLAIFVLAYLSPGLF